MLNTVEFGWIRVASLNSINRLFDTFLGQDLIGEWDFWYLASGEIVAVASDEE